jgi:hypothetical protein
VDFSRHAAKLANAMPQHILPLIIINFMELLADRCGIGWKNGAAWLTNKGE